jgi:hypothetical protein
LDYVRFFPGRQRGIGRSTSLARQDAPEPPVMKARNRFEPPPSPPIGKGGLIDTGKFKFGRRNSFLSGFERFRLQRPVDSLNMFGAGGFEDQFDFGFTDGHFAEAAGLANLQNVRSQFGDPL